MVQNDKRTMKMKKNHHKKRRGHAIRVQSRPGTQYTRSSRSRYHNTRQQHLQNLHPQSFHLPPSLLVINNNHLHRRPLSFAPHIHILPTTTGKSIWTPTMRLRTTIHSHTESSLRHLSERKLCPNTAIDRIEITTRVRGPAEGV